MKKCTMCNLEKDVLEFGKNKQRKDGRQNYCKLCSREKDKRCYILNGKRRTKIKKTRQAAYQRNRKFIYEYFKSHPCVDCKETDPVVLEFDHRRDKKLEIGRMKSYSLEVIKKEIEKCEIRCANCHKRRTARIYNWYKDLED